ncbi:MAG TPA: CNP1-like family protein [Accumulibacter sp.]|nr:CNP1-like family protein [Accumulibacter sp.]
MPAVLSPYRRLSGTARLLCLAMVLGSACPTSVWPAGDGRNVFQDVEKETPADPEAEVLPPAFPKNENLIPFSVSAPTRNQFFIDSESLVIDSDDLIRYTLVITSPSGVQNVFSEAIRCSTGERRLYATGRADGTWATSRNSQWMKIRENSLNRHHAALYLEYFCPIGIVIEDVDNLRRALRRGGHAGNLKR